MIVGIEHAGLPGTSWNDLPTVPRVGEALRSAGGYWNRVIDVRWEWVPMLIILENGRSRETQRNGWQVSCVVDFDYRDAEENDDIDTGWRKYTRDEREKEKRP